MNKINGSNLETRLCEICKNPFECNKTSKQKMCSIQCQGKWQSIHRRGENSSTFDNSISIDERKMFCQWCEKEFYFKLDRFKKNRKFCSNKCRREWYSQVFSQSQEWKEQSSKRAMRILNDGLIASTNSECQIKINELLNLLDIKYTNEEPFDKCTVDNYLNDFNLIIEVMGDYWHCNHIKYNSVNYEMQVRRIRLDKIKHKKLVKNYGIEVLYLWESDINNSYDMCKYLVKEYIDKCGKLKNYHSFNYHLENNQLVINNQIGIPYMEYEIEKLTPLIDLSVKEKMNKKQTDKWIEYVCEYCGNQSEELICHYNKQKHHYCSVECSNKAHNTKVSIDCDQCGKPIDVIKSKINKNKHFFCSQDCQHKYQRTVGFKRNDSESLIVFWCECCAKESMQKIGDYNKSEHHFCSKSCSAKFYHQHREKRLVKCICDFCGKELYKKTGDYNKSKHHFCNNRKCYYEYKKQNNQ